MIPRKNYGEDMAELPTYEVYAIRYASVVASGMLAAAGGAYLSIGYVGSFTENMTGGRGFIALAALIFGNWRPGGLAAGAGLFGYTDALQLRQGSTSVHALLLLVALLLAIIGAYLLWRRRMRPALGALVAAGAVFAWYASTGDVPIEFVPATPYIITLLVLALAAQRLRMPAADGIPWRRGQGS